MDLSKFIKVQKIILVGSGGSGKSWLAKRLADITGYKMIHLDCEYWQPNWTKTPKEEWIEKQKGFIKGEKWIIDGNYNSSMELRFAAADLVIFLDINRFVCMWSALKRHGKKRSDLPDYLEEKMNSEFIDFLKWIWTFKKNGRRRILDLHEKYPEKEFLVLKSRRSVGKFLKDLTEFGYPVQKLILHRSENFQQLTSKWCNLSSNAEVVIITDTDRLSLAIEMQSQITNNCRIINIDDETEYLPELLSLNPSDLVVALLSFNTFVFKGANKVFSPFGKPQGLKAKYAFIRLGISKESLLQGISTPTESVYETIDRLHSYKSGTKLKVTNTAGTNITLSINAFTTCEHRIVEDGGMAFLPPSETSSEVIANTAKGKIVVDVTIGQLYHYGNLLGYFGLVVSPVTLIVENGIITDVFGEDMATELKEKLFALPEDCRILVELGRGLSKMTPTGLIGVDESIIDTCHFGIGDGATCGVHLDVVISNPMIEEV